jgi:hypothetical protein
MKLKTLKDLEVPIGAYFGCESGNVKVVDIYELKQEAIKWLKDEIYPKKFTYKQISYFPRGSWIIEFFNLTEEDLK